MLGIKEDEKKMSSANMKLTKLAIGVAGVAALAGLTGKFSTMDPGTAVAVEGLPAAPPVVVEPQRTPIFNWEHNDEDEEEEYEEHEQYERREIRRPALSSSTPLPRVRTRRS